MKLCTYSTKRSFAAALAPTDQRSKLFRHDDALTFSVERLECTVCEKTLAPLYGPTVGMELLHYLGTLEIGRYIDLCVSQLSTIIDMCLIMD